MNLTKIIKSVLIGTAVFGSSLMFTDFVFAKTRNQPTTVNVKTVDYSSKQKLGRGSYIDSYFYDNPSQLSIQLNDADGIDKIVYSIGKSKKSKQIVECGGAKSKQLTFAALKTKDKTYNVSVKDSRGKQSGLAVYMRASEKTSLQIRTSKNSFKVMSHGGVFYIDTFSAGTPSKFDLVFKDGDGIDKIVYSGRDSKKPKQILDCNGSFENKLSFNASKKGNKMYTLRMTDCAGNSADVDMFVRGYKSKLRAKKKFKPWFKSKIYGRRNTYSK